MGGTYLDTLRRLGDLALHQHDNDVAEQSWRKMKLHVEQIHSEHWLAVANARLSLVDMAFDLDRMKLAWLENWRTNRDSGECAALITSCGELAETCIRRGEREEAIDLCTQAEQIAAKLGTLHADSGAAYVRAVRHIAKGELDQARHELKVSESLFARWTMPYRYWVADPLQRLGIS